MRKIIAYQIAESIDIKKMRNEYAGTEHYFNSSEVFYQGENDRFLFILSYGVIVYSGYDEIMQSQFNDYLKQFCANLLEDKLTEEFIIHENAPHVKFGYNEIFLSKFDPLILRIIMLNVGQSVALDYFSQQTVQLLETTNEYTLKLEKQGKLDITNKALLQFIGKTLNVKNRIVDSLYIFDSPDATWEDEYIHKIDSGLRNTFDLKIRFKDLDYSLQIVKENLELFRDLMQHRKSNQLEIIIIILILVEVANLLIEKFSHFLG
jgi:required for meiotic nuclear division protein 1